MARRAAAAAGEVTTGEAVDADADGGGGNERGWAAGEALVRARAALERATPERLRGVASPGEYHEALATLLLEQSWDPDAGADEWTEVGGVGRTMTDGGETRAGAVARGSGE